MTKFKRIFSPVALGIVLLSGILSAVNFSTAFTTDIETSLNNFFNATTLDAGLRVDQAIFTDVTPDAPATSNAFVQNIGELPFQYQLRYQYESGNTAVCDGLTATLTYTYFDTDGNQQAVQKYQGALSGLSVNTDSDLNNPNVNSYFANGTYADNEQWFELALSLPEGADPSLINSNCNFALVAEAWQPDFASYDQGFSDFESTSYQVSTGDWDAPEAPLGVTFLDHYDVPVACGGSVHTPMNSFDWEDSSTADFAYYQIENQNGILPNQPTSSILALVLPAPGVHQYRVRTVDASGNEGDWSAWCELTFDNSTPVTSVSATGSPFRAITQTLTNGNFETGDLTGWTSDPQSEVAVIGADSFTSPQKGSYMAKIGSSEDPGQEVSVNLISQDIPKGVRSVGFYYNFFTYDYLPFDEPGMMVFVNDKQVQQIWASDVNSTNDTSGTTAYTSGWQKMNIYLGDVEEATITIAFYGGNTDPGNASQSWLYLDEVTTADVVVNSEALFKLDVEDAGVVQTPVTTFYQIGTDGTPQIGNTFTLNSQPTGGVVSYWSVDTAGNVEPTQSFWVAYDTVAPSAISDLSVTDEGNGDYLLEFASPDDDLFPAVSEYDVRYSTTPITTDTDWQTLAKAELDPADGLLGTIRAPRYTGEAEKLTVTNLTAGEPYYFAIKSADAARNWSEMTVASINIGGPSVQTVVLNEIMFNPIGDEDTAEPSGEWVELFNLTGADIDLAGWKVQDGNGNDVLITSSNSDADLDLGDDGETTIPAGQRLVVYLETSLLDNSTDTVTLLNDSDITQDSYSYDGSGKPEGNTFARIPDGTGAWVDPVATPGTPNAETVADLKPQVKLWQQDTNNARFSLFDSQGFETAEYVVLYDHLVDANVVREGIEGSFAIGNQGRVDQNDIYLGTCSSGGIVCVPHLDLSNVSISVELIKNDGSTKNVEYQLPDAWVN